MFIMLSFQSGSNLILSSIIKTKSKLIKVFGCKADFQKDSELSCENTTRQTNAFINSEKMKRFYTAICFGFSFHNIPDIVFKKNLTSHYLKAF